MTSNSPFLNEIMGRRSLARDRELFIDQFSSLSRGLHRFRVVQVVGTNGKGSVAAAIASILSLSGAKVGLFTSPHLSDITERVVIDGRPVSSKELEGVAWNIASDDPGSRGLSFFEIMLLSACKIFSDHQIDVAIFEAGIGGGSDATSHIFPPELAVLTNVGLDHQNILGNDIRSIALEKAAVLTRSEKGIIGRVPVEALSAIDQVALSVNASVKVMGRDFNAFEEQDRRAVYVEEGGSAVSYLSPLNGSFQIDNMATAIAAARELGVSEEVCRRGVERLRWPGRLEFVNRDKLEILLDCAHNSDGIKALLSFLDKQGISKLPFLIASKDKHRLSDVVSKISPYCSHLLLFSPQIAGFSLSEADLKAGIPATGDMELRYFDNDMEAGLDFVKSLGVDRCVVTGSSYLVGAARTATVGLVDSIW